MNDQPMSVDAAPATTAVLDEVRINAMLEALQQQRDTCANQVVHLTAELAVANGKLMKAAKKELPASAKDAPEERHVE